MNLFFVCFTIRVFHVMGLDLGTIGPLDCPSKFELIIKEMKLSCLKKMAVEGNIKQL